MYKVHIENKNQVIRANEDIPKDTDICLVVDSNYLMPFLTFVGKVIQHSNEPNCVFSYIGYNKYNLKASDDIEEGDILSVDINSGPWFLNKDLIVV